MAGTVAKAVAGPEAGQHTLAQTLVLHLAPGVIITLVFIVAARLAAPPGWPPSLALLVTWLVAGIPVLAGILVYAGRRRNGPAADVLLYREPVSRSQFAGLVLVLLVWTALASTLLMPLGEGLRQSLFAWWPGWLNLATLAQEPGAYSRSTLWAVVALSAILNIAVPITEELYFRSFLLPRLPAGTAWAPLLSAVLFSLYHFWLPWDVIGRIITLLPVVYVVQWKRNVYISIWVHCLLNSLGTLGLAALVMSL